MKAIVYTEYGAPDVLQLNEAATPAPKGDEVLIRVHAASVNFGDLMARNFRNITAREFHMPLPLLLLSRVFFGFNRPKITILGNEFAGEVETVGTSVTRFKPGDQVFGYSGQNMGAYAEYVCMRETGSLAIKPANMTYAEAAAVPYGGIMAMSLLRKVNIRRGQNVLINGASGGIGSAALQLARQYGAEVTGVCGTPRAAFVKALGADHVIDYTKEDFTGNGRTYDLIFDVLGKSPLSRCMRSLTPEGIYMPVSFKTKHLLHMLRTTLAGGRKVSCSFAGERQEDLVFIKDLIEAGKYTTVIDRSYPLEQAADAHRYAESGQKQGAVVITM